MIRSNEVPVPCCVDVPDAFREKARFAIRLLLLPFRAEPIWTDVESLSQGGIYYGFTPEEVSEKAWRIGLLASTVSFFQDVGGVGAGGSDTISERMVTMDGESVPVFFESTGDAPFDPVAACFYLISGWSEWKTRERDEHGRFSYIHSIHKRLNLATVPIVDLYRRLVEKECSRRGIHFDRKTWGSAEWMFCPTHDIDYVRKWRPGIIYREVIERAVLNRNDEDGSIRTKRAASALAGVIAPGDPYRSAMTRMKDEVVRRNGRATYFFKTAARGPRDVHYDADSSYLQDTYLELRSAGFEIGLHPSYHAYNHGRYLREESAALVRASGIKATSIRTHYLRFDELVTPGLMMETGFKIDSSLGFADRTGFRRGTCLPYPLYDLLGDKELGIWEMPLSVMESTLFNRENMTLESAREASFDIMGICRKYGGIFVGLWHNILWDERDSPGWGAHFVACLDEAKSEGAGIESLSGALDLWK